MMGTRLPSPRIPISGDQPVRRAAIVMGLFVLAGVQTAVAQNPAGPPGGAGGPPAGGEIRGMVVESSTGTAVGRASIAVRPKGGTTIITGAIAAENTRG